MPWIVSNSNTDLPILSYSSERASWTRKKKNRMGLDIVHWEFYTATLKINHKNIRFLKIGNKGLNKQITSIFIV